MTISDSLSAASKPPSAKPRKVVCLTGPSVPVDPRTRAVRRDLAEFDLADRVFAQHYAVPLAMTVGSAATVRRNPSADAESVTDLAPGDQFHVLDIGGAWAWGRGDRSGSVGYVAAEALALP